MEASFLDEVKRYVAFGEADARALAELKPLLEASARPVIDTFYERILEHPSASRAITGGAEQVERLKQTLRRWLVELADGVYDESYVARRAAIGRRHVVISLPQVFMVTAIDVIRVELSAIVRRELADLPRRERALDALHKILDIDLAIMLETYHEDTMAKVRRSERRALVGELAGKVNHELRNRLGTIKSSAYLLEKQLAEAPGSVAKHLGRIQWSAERAGAACNALLDLARELKPQIVLTDLNNVVREAAAAVPPPSPDVKVVLELAPENPRVLGDPELLASAVANLIRNAVEAHQGLPGSVTLLTRVEGRDVLLRVLDEGVGFTPETERHMFEPFFSTKSDANGLGLTIAREIVAAHGGTIAAKRRAERGTELAVELRLVERVS